MKKGLCFPMAKSMPRLVFNQKSVVWPEKWCPLSGNEWETDICAGFIKTWGKFKVRPYYKFSGIFIIKAENVIKN